MIRDSDHKPVTVIGLGLMGRALIRSLADRAVAGGHGGSGYPAMIEQFRKPSAVPA